MTIPGSTFEVISTASGQLKVIAPPYYSLAAMPLLIVIISGVFFLQGAVRRRTWWPFLGILIWCGPWTLAGFSCLRSGSVTLDRTTNTAYLERPSWFWHKNSTMPLDSIRYARVMSGSASGWVALVLKNGDIVSFSDSTDQGGKGRAAEAINEYLGTSYR